MKTATLSHLVKLLAAAIVIFGAHRGNAASTNVPVSNLPLTSTAGSVDRIVLDKTNSGAGTFTTDAIGIGNLFSNRVYAGNSTNPGPSYFNSNQTNTATGSQSYSNLMIGTYQASPGTPGGDILFPDICGLYWKDGSYIRGWSDHGGAGIDEMVIEGNHGISIHAFGAGGYLAPGGIQLGGSGAYHDDFWFQYDTPDANAGAGTSKTLLWVTRSGAGNTYSYSTMKSRARNTSTSKSAMEFTAGFVDSRNDTGGTLAGRIGEVPNGTVGIESVGTLMADSDGIVSNHFGIGTAALTSFGTIGIPSFDLSCGAFPGFVFGGDLNALTRTPNQNHYAVFGVCPYNNTDRPPAMIVYEALGSGVTKLDLGYSSSNIGTATEIDFFCATNANVGNSAAQQARMDVSGLTINNNLSVTGTVNNASLTASKLVGTDAGKNLTSITVGTGLSLSAGTLTATGGGGTVSNQTVTIAGTANQVISSAGAQDLSVNRTWTLSTPQDIATSSTPQFGRIGFGVAADASNAITAALTIPTGYVTPGLDLSNSSIATVGVQMQSPAIRLGGNGWKTAATAGSQPVQGIIQLIPVQDVTSPDAYVRIATSTNSSALQNVAAWSSYGDYTNTRNMYFGWGGFITNLGNTTALDSGGGTTVWQIQGGNAVDIWVGGSDRFDFLTSEGRPAGADKTWDYGDSTHRGRSLWLANRFLLSADQTSTSASLASTTVSLPAMVTTFNFLFEFSLYVSNSINGDGVSIDLNGGNSTWTDIRAHVTITDSTGLLKSLQVSSLSTAVSTPTIAGDAVIFIQGGGHCSGTGTLIPRFAVNSHSSGTLTLYKNSNGHAENTP